MLVMLGLSWPLWVSTGDIPRVPFWSRIPASSLPFSYALFGVLLVAIGGTTVRIRPRIGFGLSLLVAIWLVLQDQHRFQPWLYLHFVVGILLTTLPPEQGPRYARWWFVSLYVHSGLSKLDRSFVDGLGAVFLNTLGRLLRFDTAHWPEAGRLACILGMPLFEIVVGLLLLNSRTRKLGIVAAVALHLSLIAVLGPWGLGHSTIVLVWNGFMAIEVAIAFGASYAMSFEIEPTRMVPPFGWAVKLAFWTGVVMPIGERWGVFDAWPSHALYASHVENVRVDVHVSASADYPRNLRDCLTPTSDELWLRADLTAWSRLERGTPIYPGARGAVGIAQGIARMTHEGLVRIKISSAADRWSGQRSRSEHVGRVAIEREADRYLLNAHPPLRGGD